MKAQKRNAQNSKRFLGFRFPKRSFILDFARLFASLPPLASLAVGGELRRSGPAGQGFGTFRDGFTLLETLVALILLSAAIAGPFALAASAIFDVKVFRHKLVALNLAQEGLEIIRSYRDNNVHANLYWAVDLGAGTWQADIVCPNPPAPCTATAVQALNFKSCGGGECADPLRYDQATGVYSYASGDPSPFRRTITIDRTQVDSRVPQPDQMKVTSDVTWSDAGIVRRVVLEELLYNWQ